MHEQRAKLTYLAGSLFGKAQELRELLRQMAEEGQDQGEIRLVYQSLDNRAYRLVLHIDRDEFTMMPDTASDGGLRLDINDSSLHLE